MFLMDDIQRFEGMSMVVLIPKSTLVANASFASFAVDTCFLVVDFAFFLLKG